MIILIDNYDSFTFNVYHYLSELGAKVKVYRNDEVTPESILEKNPKAIIISPGIFSAGHFNSTALLTMFKTPPLFNPGDSGWLINFTGISKIIFSQQLLS